MLRQLFTRSKTARPATTIPDGQRVYAIGDVHGHATLLDELLDRIVADERDRPDAQTSLIFLGDLVDRGPDSAGVVDRVERLMEQRAGVRLLLGNHEEVFRAALDGSADAIRAFCRIGGRETMLSYGLTQEQYELLSYQEMQAALVERVPARHRAMLDLAEDVIEIGDYAFVHAGIRPGVALAEQATRDLRWIREPFLSHHKPHDRMIVHGHSISPTVEITPARIGIDTGAYVHGVLSAIALEGPTRRIIAAGLAG